LGGDDKQSRFGVRSRGRIDRDERANG